jgi:tetratricopeptide (TPR) repeat protein
MEENFPGKGLPLLVEALLHKGDFATANATATRAINENPKSDYGYLLLSTIHEYRKEWSLAENVVRNALKLNDESVELKMTLAHIYAAQAKYENAQSVYDTVLVEDPDYIPALFCKGAIFDFLGNKRQAQDLYTHILDIDENYTPALNNLAYLTLEVYSDNKKALKLATQAFRNSPENARVMDTLGYALLQNGEVEKSIVFLEKAVRIMPTENSIHAHLAQAYKAGGRNEDAVTSLNNIIKDNTREVQFIEPKTLLNELN